MVLVKLKLKLNSAKAEVKASSLGLAELGKNVKILGDPTLYINTLTSRSLGNQQI